MQIGNKIKALRVKSNMTQEQLAEQVGLSAQSVSKWETGVCMPDVMMLPALAEAFGVTIDDLFDLTTDTKLNRIQNRMDLEAELPNDVFADYVEYLKAQLDVDADKRRILNLLAHLYHHRMQSDAAKVSRYAHEAMRMDPAIKDCQWCLDMAEGQYVWDWNVGNHSKVIDFYKELIATDTKEPKSPLPYYYVIDNLLADHRVEEAKQYLEGMRRLPGHKPVMIEIYRAYIALAEYNKPEADRIIDEASKEYADNCDYLFEAAQYYARNCEYDKAIGHYEQSFVLEKKPRFTDALQGISIIQQIQGKYKEAAETTERIACCMREEWGLKEEVELQNVLEEKARLLAKANETSMQS